MKVLSLAILTLLCLLQGASAQTPGAVDDELGLLTKDDANLTEPTDSDRASDTTPLIEDELGLPVMRDQLTITESSQELAASQEEISESYVKMMQDIASTLENYEASKGSAQNAQARNPLLHILIGFIIEVIVTLIVLKIAFQLCGFPSLFRQIIPLSLSVAVVGAFVGIVLHVGLFNPIRIGLSFIILLILIRAITDVREWATAIQIALTARLVSIGMMWLAFAGMMALFGL
jgi:hypothetical protein